MAFLFKPIILIENDIDPMEYAINENDKSFLCFLINFLDDIYFYGII